MTDYKLVPVEPTPEMLAAGEYALGAGCYASGIYADMLAAAPAVQGEPVAWHASDDFPDSLPNTWSREVVAVTDFGRVCRLSCMGTYWQRPGDFAEGEEVVAWADFPDLERATDASAEQKAAPDVSGLVEALECFVEWYEQVNLRNEPRFQFYDKAKKALAAFRKQGGEV